MPTSRYFFRAWCLLALHCFLAPAAIKGLPSRRLLNDVVVQVQVNGKLVDVLARTQGGSQAFEEPQGNMEPREVYASQLSTRALGDPSPPAPPTPSPPGGLPSQPRSSGGRSGDISYSTMGLIIGLVVGTLLVVFLAVLGYILCDIVKRRRAGLGRLSGGGSNASSGGRGARLISSEEEVAGDNGGDNKDQDKEKKNTDQGLPGGQEWTSIHQGIVGMELEDDPPAGGGSPTAATGGGGGGEVGGQGGGGGGQHQQRGSGVGGAATPPPPVDVLAGPAGAPASPTQPTPSSRLGGMRAAWGALLRRSGGWDWRDQVSSPLDPLACSGGESVACMPMGLELTSPTPPRKGRTTTSVPPTPGGGGGGRSRAGGSVVLELSESRVVPTPTSTPHRLRQAAAAASLSGVEAADPVSAAASVEPRQPLGLPEMVVVAMVAPAPFPAAAAEAAAVTTVAAAAAVGSTALANSMDASRSDCNASAYAASGLASSDGGSNKSGKLAVSGGDHDGSCVVGVTAAAAVIETAAAVAAAGTPPLVVPAGEKGVVAGRVPGDNKARADTSLVLSEAVVVGCHASEVPTRHVSSGLAPLA